MLGSRSRALNCLNRKSGLFLLMTLRFLYDTFCDKLVSIMMQDVPIPVKFFSHSWVPEYDVLIDFNRGMIVVQEAKKGNHVKGYGTNS